MEYKEIFRNGCMTREEMVYMNKKRGYFIHGGDLTGGFAVVATSLKEARRIVYRAGEVESDWIDISGWWCRNAKVDDLPIGVIYVLDWLGVCIAI